MLRDPPRAEDLEQVIATARDKALKSPASSGAFVPAGTVPNISPNSSALELRSGIHDAAASNMGDVPERPNLVRTLLAVNGAILIAVVVFILARKWRSS